MSLKNDREHHANQLNPNNDTYWRSRADESASTSGKESNEREGKDHPSKR